MQTAKEVIEQYLAELPEGFQLSVGVATLREKRQNKGIIRLGEFKIDEVIPFITKEAIKKDFECNGTTYSVKMNSQRYHIFNDCMKCVACGLEVAHIFLENYPIDDSPHFNFYGEKDGQLIMLTKDHIQARSKGGGNNLENYQTMCHICNNLKADCAITNEQVKILRQIWDEMCDSPKKTRHKKITDVRKEMLKNELDIP